MSSTSLHPEAIIELSCCGHSTRNWVSDENENDPHIDFSTVRDEILASENTRWLHYVGSTTYVQEDVCCALTGRGALY